MIGDVLVSSILCKNLAIKYPDAQIDYLVYENTIPILENNDHEYNIVLFKKEYRKSKSAFYLFLKQIRREKYDIVIDVYSKLESWIISFFSGAKQRISFSKSHINWLYTDVVTRHTTPETNLGLTIEQRLKSLEPLGISIPEITKPKLVVSEEENAKAKNMIRESNIDPDLPLVMVSALGSSSSKTYPLEYMAKIIDEIITHKPVNIIFNYMPDQQREIDKLYELTHGKTKKHIHSDIIGKSLRELVALINQCDFVVGNDGGVINMAKALDKPTFTIYSPIINKNGWNSFEDGIHYISVHLNDYKPHFFSNASSRTIKKQNQKLYLEFKPELFKNLLRHFLTRNAT